MKRKIASNKEWTLAKDILAAEKAKGPVTSGFKIRYKKHTQLRHSFIYLREKDGDKELLVSPTRYYLIGAGGFGRVKLVEDEEGNLFAVKMESKHSEKNKTELKVLEKLNRLRFVGEGDKWRYILQQYFPGLTLNEYIFCSDGTLTSEQKNAFIYHLAKALQVLHSNNISHGDVKEDNFIIRATASGVQIDAIDFGLSQLKANDSQKNTDIRYLAHIIESQLKWESPLMQKIMQNEISLDDLIKELKPYSAVHLPVYDGKKRLIEEYTHSVNFVEKKMWSPNKKMDSILKRALFLVKTTNNILELDELFKYIKKSERKHPILRVNSNSWELTVKAFQERAIQIAYDKINLATPINYTATYYNILSEKSSDSIFTLTRLKEFEILIQDKHVLSDYDPVQYERTKLVKSLEVYIERIESYKDNSGQLNFSSGFLFFKDSRGLNRRANYHLAVQLFNLLNESEQSITDIFSKNNLDKLRNSSLPLPTLKGIHSWELNSIIEHAEKAGKIEDSLSGSVAKKNQLKKS